jgi:ATP-dependent Clp protease ATP-binding subunit ClpA
MLTLDDAPSADRSSDPISQLRKAFPTEDLTERARLTHGNDPSPFAGEPVFDSIFHEIYRILHRRHTHNIVLVGDRGIGKSTLVAELARRAVLGDAPFLADRRFFWIDAKFTLPSEGSGRLATVVEFAKELPNAILCIDGLASLLCEPFLTENKRILASALYRQNAQIIATMESRKFEELIAGDSEMLEFFSSVPVQEPEPPLATRLLHRFSRGLAESFRLNVSDEAVRRAVDLSNEYILNERLPGKALRVLHRACENVDFRRSQLGESKDTVDEDEVLQVVSETTGVPAETLQGVGDAVDYESHLGRLVFGQEHAIRDVANELKLIKAGLTDANRPAFVVMFIGQTGTGKTELAKALAQFYSHSKRLRIYTLGNFIEQHSVSGIIGVPPGYVGHELGGRLINDLNADPYGVFLFDEVDKAHPDVLQPFLNLFDEGWICDQRGVRAFANRAIFVLTTNVGQKMLADLAAKETSQDEITRRFREMLPQIRHTKSNRPVFTPEFLARVNRVIVFNPLDAKAMEKIADRIVQEMKTDWQQGRQRQLNVDASIVEEIARDAHELDKASKGREGGRIVRKLVAERISLSIQRAIGEDPSAYVGCRIVDVERSENTEDDRNSNGISVTFRT